MAFTAKSAANPQTEGLQYHLRMKAGCICVVIADRVRDEFKVTDEMERSTAEVANEAIKILAKKG